MSGRRDSHNPAEEEQSSGSCGGPVLSDGVTHEAGIERLPIVRYPYDPCGWLRRAEMFAEHGYPELVIGDCWKSIQLCHSIVAADAACRGFRLGWRCGFWMQDMPMSQDEAQYDCEGWTAVRQRLHAIEKDAAMLQRQCMRRGSSVSGPYFRQQYPWLLKRHRCRSDQILHDIDADLAKACLADKSGRRCRCVARRHALNIADDDNDNDVLGIFANTNIPAGQLFLIDESNVQGCRINLALIDRVTKGDEGTLARLDMTREEASKILELLCFSDIDDVARTLLKVRCLRRIVRDNAGHPLDHPVLARLKPTYHNKESADFHLMDDIQVPNKALSAFGVDIYANQDFDCWVLYTIEARIDNNCFTTSTSACLATLFALFNHSCAPNVHWNSSRNGSVHLYAKRDIRAGEQLLVTYNEYAMNKPVLQRQADLARWIDGLCQCSRCRKESQEEADGRIIAAVQQRAAWDSFEKAIFPEDNL